ncbi:MAG: methionyl-tRNA formyltransferase, partial [Helicobacteraceae bacterium]|nr:methionyl-tRNA formyltransferase [Helicobacteraceae bacterium]
MRKIVFLGTPDYAALILEGLIKRAFDVALVITNEDKPVGRKQIMTAPSVKITAQKYALDLLQPRKLDDAYDRIEAAKPEFIIVAAYGQIVSKRILAIAPCLNLHASLLPKYRGASPIQ